MKSLRRALYICAVTGLLCSLPAGWWCLGHLMTLLPSLKTTMHKPSETVLVLVLVGSIVPFVFAAVLQGASAFRVLRKLPDEQRLNMPGLDVMNAVAPVAHFVFSVVALLLVIILTAIVLVVFGFVAAYAIPTLFATTIWSSRSKLTATGRD